MAAHEKKPPAPRARLLVRLGLLVAGFVLLIVMVALVSPPLAGWLASRQSLDSTASQFATQAAISIAIQATPLPVNLATVTASLVAPVAQASQSPSFVPPTLISPLPAPGLGQAVLSIMENSYAHLFLFQSESMTFTRLTNGDWQDIDPALSSDGKMLAFSSNRSGYWDLYVMLLEAGKTLQLTNSPEYESHPGWSPDNHWLAYETYLPSEAGGDLEIMIRTLDGSQEPVRLTNDPAADYAPAWSPAGRSIAFVSTRSGEPDIWLADLDRPLEMFRNLSRDPALDETDPAWSPDGGRLCWTATDPDGITAIRIWDAQQPNDRARFFAAGSLPAWGANGEVMLAVYPTPNRNYLTGFRLADGRPVLPLVQADGEILGLAWGTPSLSVPNSPESLAVAQITPLPLWLARLQASAEQPAERVSVVPLPDVQAPFAMLQDQADEAFQALRERLAREIGWDFLAVLDQAYVPLTVPLEPGFQQDWLYTGRAFQFNSAPVSAGWVETVREDYGAQTYWRIYLRTRFQDGSQGRPLKSLPWDLNARHAGIPQAFEQGGLQKTELPAGYWVDFTRLASAYGWERLPSLSSWQAAYSSIRYNEYLLRQGLDWFAAMLQVYPRQALDSPTPVSSPTITPTFTSTPTHTPTNTETRYIEPSITPSLTRRPTLTPTPSATRRPTLTPVPTALP